MKMNTAHERKASPPGKAEHRKVEQVVERQHHITMQMKIKAPEEDHLPEAMEDTIAAAPKKQATNGA